MYALFSYIHLADFSILYLHTQVHVYACDEGKSGMYGESLVAYKLKVLGWYCPIRSKYYHKHCAYRTMGVILNGVCVFSFVVS